MTIAMMLFGNGYGMSQPHGDGAFYWLVDTLHDRELGKGRFYTTGGWFGAQLKSFEWFCPPPGTRRRLLDREFVVFNTYRGRFWLMHNVSWAMTDMPEDHDEKGVKIREMLQELKNI